MSSLKATGIVRRIDDLGRIVIPKEIRKTMKIHEGDPLEIYVEGNEEQVVLKKYTPMASIKDAATTYCNTLAELTGLMVCITDKKQIIEASSGVRKDMLSHELNDDMLEILRDRGMWTTKQNATRAIIVQDKYNYFAQAVQPIIVDTDIVGSIIMFSIEPTKNIGQMELKLLECTAIFLGKQLE